MTRPVVVRGDARRLPLPDASVDLIVTSPPYFALRDYRDGDASLAGQIGSEPTPAAYIAALVECTREWARVLKPGGSCFVDLGDKYAGSPSGPRKLNEDGWDRNRSYSEARLPRRASATPAKSLMLLPERYRIACVDQLGLIARAVIVWSKCLSGGTMVYARTKGRDQAIKLHDLCRHYDPADVQLWTGEKWSQVRAWERTPRGEAQYEIELRSGERIGCTPEHRWPTRRGVIRSDELAVGDVLDTCRLPDGEVAPAALDDEMVGWLIGLYIAEGSRSEQTIQFAGHVKELERFKRLSEIAAAFHGTARVHATGGNTATINLTGAVLRGILETYVGGRTAKDKHLAPKCWQRSNRFLRAVLEGYLSGDGHWREDAHRWIVGFIDNDALAADLRVLGARLGLSVRLTRCTHTGFGKEWPGWRGNITDSHRRRQPDSEVVAIRPSRARQFWDVAIEDEPHLFALASGVLTHNSNGLPESVTDRVRRSHEEWVHLTKSPRYFAAVDEIRESYDRFRPGGVANGSNRIGAARLSVNVDYGGSRPEQNALGKLPGSVWTIATEPLQVPAGIDVDHFAAYPTEWPRRLILGWSPSGICTACGEGRRPVVVKELELDHFQRSLRGGFKDLSEPFGNSRGINGDRPNGSTRATITGYACACPEPTAPTRPAVVLDPFGGTGTTAHVAAALGRIGITVDLSGGYSSKLAASPELFDRRRRKVLGLDPPKSQPQVAGQLGFFDDEGVSA